MHHISRRLCFSPSLLSKNKRASEASYLVGGWSRRNSAVASPADATADVSSKDPGRRKKRISKAERKSLVVSFVNHYREMNAGKFPTASEAKKEVGGGYYTVRQVIQELEYETRVPSTSFHRQYPKTEVSEKTERSKDMDVKGKVKQPEHKLSLAEAEMLQTVLPTNDVSVIANLEEKEASKEINLSSGKEPVSDCQMVDAEIKKVAHTPDPNDVASVDAGEKPLKGNASVLDQKIFSYKNATSSATDDQTEVTASRTDLFNEETKVVHQTPEILVDTMKEKTIPKDDHQLESPETLEPSTLFLTGAPSLIYDNSLSWDMSKEHKDDLKSPKKSFSWSLKSLADDIINFWRKL